MSLNPIVHHVTQAIAERSRATRERYLDRIATARGNGPRRNRLSCGNLAHGFAGCSPQDKQRLRDGVTPNIGIITAYNDMLSAHQPYERYPEIIRAAARARGATAEVAGGVPAMCDGVTQGRIGMELSLFSRDTIALATGIALSHDMFDAALYLGICDKIVPGLLIAALHFGHIPALFVPAGPMPSGASNDEKARVRQRYAEGKADRAELLDVEARSYHAPGTCTFYGTANSNQMLMEIMGLQLPGSSFVHPNTELRDALTVAAVEHALAITALGDNYLPPGHIVGPEAIVNGVIGLHATGGSTNHLIHLVAIARAAGLELRLEDFDALAGVVPLLAKVYPNGSADVNQFHAAGGMGYLVAQLLDAGLLHGDFATVTGEGMDSYRKAPFLHKDKTLQWLPTAAESMDTSTLRPVSQPFRADGGLRLLSGNLGRAVIKVSSVPEDRYTIEAPARVFDDQESVQKAFDRGEFTEDVVVVVRYQGPRANGMPELHKLTPALGVLQGRGLRVALVTDGRMSGASGKIPSAIHLTPEAICGGAIAKLRDGDRVRVCAVNGRVEVLMDAQEWEARAMPPPPDLSANRHGLGREMFALFRAQVSSADTGATLFGVVE
ncbi:6-phosphogluconate dehydratase [Tahibacter aquaticus]|uniref:Phosphogluconate dehydratase n=1 Tax=Tahibacter aquaticus TaxID=520092 RepID=A0A4R6YVW2_9GAMM|nr:phosphogluconate dehydratase [Tahibacter aquaticus]TDR42619.1 6-phosphogluconate dehydratase [Tahibacter aquaticus]